MNFDVKGQNSLKSFKNSPYDQSLMWHIEYLMSHSMFIDSIGEVNTFYIKDNYPSKDIILPLKNMETKVIKLNDTQIKNKGKKEPFHLILIMPMSWKNNKLTIQIIDYQVK
ncbi:MAG: hypothetical protein AAF696_11020, partial [Bacteroidota bacterium]